MVSPNAYFLMTPERWQQIDGLLEEALGRATDERAAFLDQACAGDAALRHKVEALLAAHEQAKSFIETPAMQVAAQGLAEQARSMVGRQLGHYQILALLGAGGMGEVYRARDTKLDRLVALKFLPATVAADRDRMQRFIREARAASAINHPNVATVYEIGETDGINFIAMEYVEGQTLQARLGGGSLDSAEVVGFGVQIADALDAAHMQGITHRDIKPANLMLNERGQVKVLDFGLAKMTRAAELSEGGASTLGTTAPGIVMGTVRYMSPEQVLGRELDHRTDIFSLGVVLYEMATGRLPFGGTSVGEAMDQILHATPDSLSRFNRRVPAELDWIVRKCLEKERERRYQSARELLVDLKNLQRDSVTGAVATTRVPAQRWTKNRRLALVTLAVAALVLIAASLAIWQLRPAAPPGTVARLNLALLPNEQLGIMSGSALALSPDGAALAYVASRGGGQWQVYVRALDQLEGVPLPGTEGGFAPFFSPNGKWLGFFTAGKLKKVSLSGGTPVTLCDAQPGRGASWGADDVIVFAPRQNSPIFRVSAAGGTPVEITTLQGGRFHSWPEILPSGDALLFTTAIGGGPSFEQPQIEVQSLKTGVRRVLVEDGSHPHYTPTGHLVFARAGTLMAVRFDAERLEVSGTPVQVLEGVMQTSGIAAQFSCSRPGSLVYVPGGLTLRQLVWVDRKGVVEPIAAPPHLYAHPRLSPDGQRVAVTVIGPKNDIWIYDLQRGGLSRLTYEDNNHYPIWSPDGKRIVFRSNKPGAAPNIFWKAADGSGEVERLTTSETEQVPESWTPDGKTLVFVEVRKSWDIWKLPLAGERKPELFLGTPFLDGTPQLSPDGHLLAYTSDESGRQEIYVRPFPGSGERLPISTEGGATAAWRGDGRELFYRQGPKMMAVAIALKPQLSAGKPTFLFEGRFEGIQGKNYDVSRDGQRFLLVQAVQQAAPTHFNFVLNWFEELKHR